MLNQTAFNLHLQIMIFAGILVIGGYRPSSYAVEFWSSTNADQGSCQLSDYPRSMGDSPTVNLVANKLIACWGESCDIYQEGAWKHLQDTIDVRSEHSAVSLKVGVSTVHFS